MMLIIFLIYFFSFSLVKTIAKPVASRMKVEAKKHPNMMRTCLYVGQFTYQITARINLLAQGGIKVLKINPLPEEDALSRGVNFLSECFVFTVAGTIIIIEYNRSETKSAIKSKKDAEREADFLSRLGSLESQLAELSSKEQNNTDEKLFDLDKRLQIVEKVSSYWAMKEISQDEVNQRKQHHLHVPSAVKEQQLLNSILGTEGSVTRSSELLTRETYVKPPPQPEPVEQKVSSSSSSWRDNPWYSWLDAKWLYGGSGSPALNNVDSNEHKSSTKAAAP
jgi:hypothetical protein